MKHEKQIINAPNEVDGITSSDEFDRSDLSSLYPEPAKDDRPLLKSDEERHRLHDQALRAEVRVARKFSWRFGTMLWVPLYLAYVTVSTYLALPVTEDERTFLTLGLIIAFGVVIAIFVFVYKSIIALLDLHGVNGGFFVLATLLVLAVAALPMYSVSQFSDNIWLNLGIFAGISLAVSLVVSKISLFVMTMR